MPAPSFTGGISKEVVFEVVPESERADETGVVIGAAVLVVVTVVNEIEAATLLEATTVAGLSTVSLEFSLTGDLHPSLNPDNIAESFLPSIEAFASDASKFVGLARGFTKFTLNSSSSSSFVRKILGNFTVFALNR